MHTDFFFMAATPVVKVFRMLVALRKASWEPPSRPAMDPDNTIVVPARPAKRLLIIFLWKEKQNHSPSWSLPPSKHYPGKSGPVKYLTVLIRATAGMKGMKAEMRLPCLSLYCSGAQVCSPTGNFHWLGEETQVNLS